MKCTSCGAPVEPNKNCAYCGALALPPPQENQNLVEPNANGAQFGNPNWNPNGNNNANQNMGSQPFGAPPIMPARGIINVGPAPRRNSRGLIGGIVAVAFVIVLLSIVLPVACFAASSCNQNQWQYVTNPQDYVEIDISIRSVTPGTGANSGFYQAIVDIHFTNISNRRITADLYLTFLDGNRVVQMCNTRVLSAYLTPQNPTYSHVRTQLIPLHSGIPTEVSIRQTMVAIQ